MANLIAPPQRSIGAPKRPRLPEKTASTSPFGGGVQTVSQNSIIKNVQKIMPRIEDKNRQGARDQLVEALLREVSMANEKMLEISQTIQELVASSKDGCSSGGTDP